MIGTGRARWPLRAEGAQGLAVGSSPIVRSADASADVRAPADVVFAFLADLGNHWQLASRWIKVVTLTPATGQADGATVRLVGPLGISRTVQTRVDAATPPHAISGHGRSGRTRAQVGWLIEPAGDGTRVSVGVDVVQASPLDRMAWRLGGRAWLARRLSQTVGALDELLAAHGTRAAGDVPVPAG